MLERVKEIVADTLGTEAEKLTEATSFKVIWMQIHWIYLKWVMALEEEFGKEIPTEDLEKIATIGDVVAYLEK